MATTTYTGQGDVREFGKVTRRWVPQAMIADALMHAVGFFALFLIMQDGFHLPSALTSLGFWSVFAGFFAVLLAGFAILSIIFPRHYMQGVPLDYRLVFVGLTLSFVGSTGAFLILASALPVFSIGMWAFAWAIYWVRVLGITVGYHRLATHRAFKAGKLFSRGVYGGGATGRQQTVGWWGLQHRIHHDRTEIEDQDPHTPRQRPFRFIHAHVEWVWYQLVYPSSIWRAKKYTTGLRDDPLVQEQSKYYWPVMIFGFVLPVLIFGPFDGFWEGFKAFSLGLLSFVASHNVTMTVNSWSHTWGPKPFANVKDGRDLTGDSRDPWYLAPFSAGENLQNIHHLMDSIACYWVDRWHPDYSGAIIVALERLGRISWLKWAGLPYDLKTIGPQQLQFLHSRSTKQAFASGGV